MRLWTLHPSLLDRQGLTAVWREGLLAQAVLLGRTKGYTAHPQLDRFRVHADPEAAIGAYLAGVQQEATRRGYRYDAERIAVPPHGEVEAIPATAGQLEFEWGHLLRKLAIRSPELHEAHAARLTRDSHPLFVIVPGDVEPWERGRE
ncbi:pyrimidine dimer DNA glycosylase/endonuclease V [Microbacterium sp. JZ101]